MFWTGPLKGLGLIAPLLTGLLLLPSTTLSLTTLIAMMTASMKSNLTFATIPLEMTSNLNGINGRQKESCVDFENAPESK